MTVVAGLMHVFIRLGLHVRDRRNTVCFRGHRGYILYTISAKHTPTFPHSQLSHYRSAILQAIFEYSKDYGKIVTSRIILASIKSDEL